jgi:ferric-dicitrate binding protein FerR (iron transport regulator)
MNEHEPLNLTPEQEKVRDLVRDLGEVHANPDFRARLNREFVTGRLEDLPGIPAPPSRFWRTALRWAYIPAAAAAFFVILSLGNRGVDWKVIDSSSDGTVVVDGERVNLRSAGSAALEKLIKPGRRIELSRDAQLTLLGQNTLVFQITPGTRMTVPNMPGRWYGRTLNAKLWQGEVRFLTSPDFAGNKLAVTTAEGTVEVTGTIVSVLRDENMRVTCVCVMKGEASVGANEDDMEPIPPGMRKVMFGDGRDPMVVAIMPEHRDGLIPFVDRNARYLEDSN